MSARVLAIGMDAADPAIVNQWINDGSLPHLAKLRATGVHATLNNHFTYRERPVPFPYGDALWVISQNGVLPNKSGFWQPLRYVPEQYDFQFDTEVSGHTFDRYKPFYALGEDYKVAVFDLPLAGYHDDVNGVQILGWGGHAPFVRPGSRPEGLKAELEKTYGENTLLHKDYAAPWNRKRLKWVEDECIKAIEQRTRICRDLIARDEWDLFLTVFGEVHSAEHLFWFMSVKDHPLYECMGVAELGYEPLLRVFQAVDDGIGQLRQAAGADTVFCYSVHGMSSNTTDLGSLGFLPELMFRRYFPDHRGIKERSGPISDPIVQQGKGWKISMLDQLEPPALWRAWLHKLGLISTLDKYKGRLWEEHPELPETLKGLPANWYRPYWKQMPAFALPSFFDGQIRINLKGRDSHGLVEAAEYDELCDELAEFLLKTTDGRTGDPVVVDVIRTREADQPDDPSRPMADLMVRFTETPFDVTEHPQAGRIGPLPYNRSGGHVCRGMLIAGGTGIHTNQQLENPMTIDLAPTMLGALHAPIPEHFDGRDLFAQERLFTNAATATP